MLIYNCNTYFLLTWCSVKSVVIKDKPIDP